MIKSTYHKIYHLNHFEVCCGIKYIHSWVIVTRHLLNASIILNGNSVPIPQPSIPSAPVNHHSISVSLNFIMLCCVALCWVAQLCPTLCGLMDCSLPVSSVQGNLQARILAWVAMPSPPVDLPNPGIKPRSPTLQADSLLLIMLGASYSGHTWYLSTFAFLWLISVNLFS